MLVYTVCSMRNRRLRIAHKKRRKIKQRERERGAETENEYIYERIAHIFVATFISMNVSHSIFQSFNISIATLLHR